MKTIRPSSGSSLAGGEVLEVDAVGDDGGGRAGCVPAHDQLVAPGGHGHAVDASPPQPLGAADLALLEAVVGAANGRALSLGHAAEELVLDVVLVEHHPGRGAQPEAGHLEELDLDDVELPLG